MRTLLRRLLDGPQPPAMVPTLDEDLEPGDVVWPDERPTYRPRHRGGPTDPTVGELREQVSLPLHAAGRPGAADMFLAMFACQMRLLGRSLGEQR